MKKLQKRLLNGARVVLLLGTVACIGTVVLWKNGTQFINRVDDRLVREYEAWYRDDYEAAVALMKQDAERGLAKLESQRRRLREFEKGDRLWPLRRELHRRLAEELLRRGRREEALARIDEILADDDRDLPFALLRAQALRDGPDGEMAYEEALGGWARRFPTAALLSEPYLELLLAQGRDREAFQQAWRAWGIVTAQITSGWMVFWDEGQGFSAALSEAAALELDPLDGEHVLKAVVPSAEGQVFIVRIDLPAMARVRIDDWKLVLRQGAREFELLPLGPAPFTPKDMELGPTGRLTASGSSDAFFHVRLPQPLSRAEPIEVELRGRVRPLLPDLLEAMLADPARVRALEQALDQEGADREQRYLKGLTADRRTP